MHGTHPVLLIRVSQFRCFVSLCIVQLRWFWNTKSRKVTHFSQQLRVQNEVPFLLRSFRIRMVCFSCSGCGFMKRREFCLYDCMCVGRKLVQTKPVLIPTAQENVQNFCRFWKSLTQKRFRQTVPWKPPGCFCVLLRFACNRKSQPRDAKSE